MPQGVTRPVWCKSPDGEASLPGPWDPQGGPCPPRELPPVVLSSEDEDGCGCPLGSALSPSSVQPQPGSAWKMSPGFPCGKQLGDRVRSLCLSFLLFFLPCRAHRWLWDSCWATTSLALQPVLRCPLPSPARWGWGRTRALLLPPHGLSAGIYLQK